MSNSSFTISSENYVFDPSAVVTDDLAAPVTEVQDPSVWTRYETADAAPGHYLQVDFGVSRFVDVVGLFGVNLEPDHDVIAPFQAALVGQNVLIQIGDDPTFAAFNYSSDTASSEAVRVTRPPGFNFCVNHVQGWGDSLFWSVSEDLSGAPAAGRYMRVTFRISGGGAAPPESVYRTSVIWAGKSITPNFTHAPGYKVRQTEVGAKGFSRMIRSMEVTLPWTNDTETAELSAISRNLRTSQPAVIVPRPSERQSYYFEAMYAELTGGASHDHDQAFLNSILHNTSFSFREICD